MTPRFALDLALDGIRLLQRTTEGWTVLGAASTDDPELDSRLGDLLAEAESRSPGGVTTELVIPPSQILYTTLDHVPGARLTEASLRARLVGMTPCDPEELAFDWELEGDRIRLAVLERTTLREAEAFADAHGFRPVAFTARPAPGEFPRDPDFGATSMAADFEPGPAAIPGAPSFASTRPVAAPDPGPAAAPEALRLEDHWRSNGPDAAALARTLTAPPKPKRDSETEAMTLFGLRGAKWTAATDMGADLRLKIAAGVGVAAIVWAAYFGLRSDQPLDPAAVLPDQPPAVATVAPDLAAPVPEAPAPAAQQAAAPEDRASLPVPGGLIEAPAASDRPGDLATRPPETMTGDNPRLRYAATGIWAEGPDGSTAPGSGGESNTYLTSIDPVTRASDAIALIPPVSLVPDPRPSTPLPPPPAGTAFRFDERGLVVATPEGAFTPDGIRVTLGRPSLVPPVRPGSDPSSDPGATPAAPALAEGAIPGLEPTDLALSLPDRRPVRRPSGLVERSERINLGGRTRTELAGLKPRARPASEQDAVAAAPDSPPSDLAVAASLVPRDRPADLAARAATNRAVAAALATPAPQPVVRDRSTDEDDGEPEVAEARSSAPDIPTSASVARQATIENAISLRDINLIGVYGTDGNRRALVRLASGRYVKVKVGDRLDGGQIAAIGRKELRYIKSGRNITLTIPSG